MAMQGSVMDLDAEPECLETPDGNDDGNDSPNSPDNNGSQTMIVHGVAAGDTPISTNSNKGHYAQSGTMVVRDNEEEEESNDEYYGSDSVSL